MTVVGTYDSDQQKIFFTKPVDIDGSVNIDGNINITGNMTFNGEAPSDSDGLVRSLSFSIDWRNADNTIYDIISTNSKVDTSAQVHYIRHHKDPNKFFAIPKCIPTDTSAIADPYYFIIYEFEFGSTAATRLSGITQTNYFDFESKLLAKGDYDSIVNTRGDSNPPFFSNDGTKLWFIGGPGFDGTNRNAWMVKFNLSTPFDITTSNNGSLSTQATTNGRTDFLRRATPLGWAVGTAEVQKQWFNRDGTRFYSVLEPYDGYGVYYKDLSSAYNISLSLDDFVEDSSSMFSNGALQPWIDSADSDGYGNLYEFYGQTSFYSFRAYLNSNTSIFVRHRDSGGEEASVTTYSSILGADPSNLTLPTIEVNGGFLLAGIRDYLDSTTDYPKENSLSGMEIYLTNPLDINQDGFTSNANTQIPLVWKNVISG